MTGRETVVAAVAAALAAGLAVAATGALLRRGLGPDVQPLAAEAIDDHLRVLATAHPLAMETGDPHALKPWLSGQLDFSPAVPTAPASGLVLRGATVGYVFDRKAAVLLYRLRLHLVTLLAFRAEGLPWPTGGQRVGASPQLAKLGERGFHAVLWRSSGLGYALVSDSDPAELTGLAGALAAGTTGEGTAGAAP